MTLAEALARPPRPNAEGIVVASTDGKRLLKIKQSDYIALHRAISKLSAKSIWQAVGEGSTLDEIQFGMPEEFWEFIETTYTELRASLSETIKLAAAEYHDIADGLDAYYGAYAWGRKEFAACAQKSDYRNLLFLLLDGRDISPVVWKSLKPSADGTVFKREEDVA